ncbi:carbohydrate ABC transporter permease [Staphylococcus saccharolyticus]|uniref:carbohydrate ABC transporter permease n=1 Tax=Staphylococcus saccharolyticus TaxID=33028 RepID=UPI0032DFE549
MNIPKDKSAIIIRIFSIIFILIMVVSIILPMINIFALAFNSEVDAQKGGIIFYPRKFSLDNFKEIFKQGTLLNALFISIAKTVIGRIPLYILLNQLHLTDTFWVYILPSIYSVYNILIMRTFFNQLPSGVIEAARVDGCNDFQIFWKIVLPMSKPIVASITLFNAVNQWNDWFTGAFFVRNPNLKPLATVLQDMLTRQAAIADALKQKSGSYAMLDKLTITGDSMQMAMIVLMTIPVLLLFPFVQKHFVEGINIGSTKE